MIVILIVIVIIIAIVILIVIVIVIVIVILIFKMLFLILLSLLLLLESCNSLKVSPPLSSLKCKLSKTKLNLSPGAVSIIKGAATLPAIYSLMSLNEYITHRYYQYHHYHYHHHYYYCE